MKILKFGGSSVSTSDRILGVANIVKEKYEVSEPLAVVVSAFGGATDELILTAQEAALGDIRYQERFLQLQNRHMGIAEHIIAKESLEKAFHYINQQFQELQSLLQGIMLLQDLSKRTLDSVMSFGERLSAYIISTAIQTMMPASIFLDARQLIKTDRNFGSARVNYGHTFTSIQNFFGEKRGVPIVPIITGFIGSTVEGETTTLGRGGSDFTAAIFGAALQAEEIEIWTDVDGVMTADPRKVSRAFSIPQMTYKEALEMSHFGAKVIHPPTIAPAMRQQIPIRIKNTFNPHAIGTLISKNLSQQQFPICGISSIDNVSLLRLEGSGIVGVCGTAMRLFGALAKKEINVILISQGSSEHSICFAVAPECAIRAKEALEEEFVLEMRAVLIDPIIVEEGLSIIAAVGENMRKTPGISGRLFGSLGKHGINVVAMVQGSSEHNISVVIKKEHKAKALNVIHEEFFLTPRVPLNLFIVGTGLIGKALLDQMRKQIPLLRQEHALDIQILGIANSQKMHFAAQGISLSEWETLLDSSMEEMEVENYLRHMRESYLQNSIFIDCTASEEMAWHYKAILAAGISIVTPNKKGNTGPYSYYRELKTMSKSMRVRYLYEATVGAGLPILSTLRDLLLSGDKIIKIEAILSGTLSYLFNRFTEGKTFSETLREAQDRGFTEPDPREDLNGKDVQRKLLILARESGYPLELEDIALEPLLPADCFAVNTIEEFYSRLAACDSLMEEKRAQAARGDRLLRYIATLDNGKASIGLQEVGREHPFFCLSGSDNIIALTTERYCHHPLVIKGAGAGAEVTASGIFAEIIHIGLQ